MRADLFSRGPGYLLYRVTDACVDAGFPMLRKIGAKLEHLEEEIFAGRSSEAVRDISNAKQEIINFRKVVRPQRVVFRDFERSRHPLLADELGEAISGGHAALEVVRGDAGDADGRVVHHGVGVVNDEG